MSQQHIQRMERLDNAQRLNTDHLGKLATVFGVNALQIFEGYVPPPAQLVQVPILDEVQAGAFADMAAAIEPPDLHAVDSWLWVDYPRSTLFALRVRGDSMDRVAPEGSLVIADYGLREIPQGQLGVFRHGGAATFKRYRVDEGGAWLEPDSTNPRHQRLFPTPEEPFEIVGKVVDIRYRAEASEAG